MDLHTRRTHNEQCHRSTWGIGSGASRGADSVGREGVDAGTHIGFIAGHGARDLWLLCMMDATRVRRTPHGADLRYLLWARALAVCEAAYSL